MSPRAPTGLDRMTFTGVLAQLAVSDLGAAERWCTALFGAAPDERPMDGLLVWNLTASGGVQVWHDPQRAGSSCVVLAVDDLDALADRLTGAGIDHGGVEPGGGARLLRLTAPDGDLVVVTGS